MGNGKIKNPIGTTEEPICFFFCLVPGEWGRLNKQRKRKQIMMTFTRIWISCVYYLKSMTSITWRERNILSIFVLFQKFRC